jgi:hypothetical protein
LPLYDDGAHNDANANDGIFGNSITMSGASMQYYIYAENDTIGKFLPARAEHEFLTLTAANAQPTPGDVVINEILADNSTNVKDEYNDREDWVEFYNNTTNVIDLGATYLGTRSDNKLKWKFPTGTYILPNSYLIVWADDDSLEQILHTNFGLNKISDTMYLSSMNGSILDSVSFSNQLPDISYGRYPNGTGPFIAMNTSYNSYNIDFPLAIQYVSKEEILNLYPNPTQDELTVNFDGKKQIQVNNLFGQKILSTTAKNTLNINTSQWTNGIYILKCGNSVRKFVVSH